VPRRGRLWHVRPRQQRDGGRLQRVALRHKKPLERDDVERPPRTAEMIRKLKSGEYRLYSRKKDPKTGRQGTSARSAVVRLRRNTSAQYSSSSGISAIEPATLSAAQRAIPSLSRLASHVSRHFTHQLSHLGEWLGPRDIRLRNNPRAAAAFIDDGHTANLVLLHRRHDVV
jgi:hypothetical protein